MITRSVVLFIVAGLMEIGGGYLMWLCLREKWAWWVGALGAFALMLRNYSDTSTGPFRKSVRCLRRGVRCDVHALGLVHRWSTARPLGHRWRFALHCRSDHHYVRSTRS